MFLWKNKKIIILLSRALQTNLNESSDHSKQTLRKQTYSNIEKISPPKTENFQIKTDIFHISAQNIDCGYLLELPQQGGSKEYPQSMFF